MRRQTTVRCLIHALFNQKCYRAAASTAALLIVVLLIINIVFGCCYFFSFFLSLFYCYRNALRCPETLYFPFIDIQLKFVNVPPAYWCVCVWYFLLLEFFNYVVIAGVSWMNTKWVNVCDVCFFFVSLYNNWFRDFGFFIAFEWFIQFPWMFMTHVRKDANFWVFFLLFSAIHKNICDHLWFLLMRILRNVCIKSPNVLNLNAAFFIFGNITRYKQTKFYSHPNKCAHRQKCDIIIFYIIMKSIFHLKLVFGKTQV